MTGTGLRSWNRDAGLPASAGDAHLVPPSAEEVASIVTARMLRPGAPPPVEVRWSYARWKPAVSLCAAYGVRFPDGSEETLVAKRHAEGKAEAIAERHPERASAGDAGWSTCLGPPMALPEQGLYLWAAHDDRELPALRHLSDLHRSRRLLRELDDLLGASIRKRQSSSHLLRYRPERRAVLRLDLALRDASGARSQRTLAARALPPERAARVEAWRRACGVLPLGPPLVGLTERTGLLLEGWLDVDVPAPDEYGHAGRAGRALAELHALPVADGAAVDPAGDASRRAASLQQIRPLFDWQPELARLTAGLAADLPGEPGALAWTHGDFHPDQVATARADGTSRLLDLDELGPGDTHADLATWIADHLGTLPTSDWEGARRFSARLPATRRAPWGRSGRRI